MGSEDSRYRAAAVLGIVLLPLALTQGGGMGDGREAAPPEPFVVIDVQGDVDHPGVRVMRGTNVTVREALEAAGGPFDGAAGLSPDRDLQTGDLLRATRNEAGDAVLHVGPMAPDALVLLRRKLDLNGLTKEELLLVPGMKDAFAEYIVKRREEKPWRSLRELSEIPGVGPKTVKKWSEYLEIAN